MAKKISIRIRGVLFALVMSCCTALIVSGVIVYLHTESSSDFINSWTKAFITAWPIVFIAILTIAPPVNRLLDLFVEDVKPEIRRAQQYLENYEDKF
jgi:hypothetical protein